MAKQRYRLGLKTDQELRSELQARSIPIPFCGCQVWLGRVDRGGYGRVATGAGRGMMPYYAHRLAYEFAKGPMPDGLVTDHLCRVRSCVNPDHLEAVTIVENLRRGAVALGPRWGDGIRKMQAAKTHCPMGHPYSGDNLILHKNRRSCRECVRSKQREWARKKALAKRSAYIIET